ncbi:MAG: glycosyltransferase family 2 protein [Planctomycetes bacterium]|nr:glycosyltransferase family 2 protein [Planctomycetota bacterium]
MRRIDNARNLRARLQAAKAHAAERARALAASEQVRRDLETEAVRLRQALDAQHGVALDLEARLADLTRELAGPVGSAWRALRAGLFNLRGRAVGRYPPGALSLSGMKRHPARGRGWHHAEGADPEIIVAGPFDPGWTVLGFTVQADAACSLELVAFSPGREARWDGGRLFPGMTWRQYALELPDGVTDLGVRFRGWPGGVFFANHVARRATWWTCRLLSRSDDGRARRARGDLLDAGLGLLLPGAAARYVRAFSPPPVPDGPATAARARSARRAGQNGEDRPDLVEPVFRPLRGVARHPDRLRFPWRADDADPQMVASGPFPAGWVRFTCEIVAEVPSWAVLYVDAGPGVSEARTVTLGRVDAAPTTLVRIGWLPKETRALRLDPMTEPGGFAITRFSVRRVDDDEGRAAALRDIAEMAPYGRWRPDAPLEPLRDPRLRANLPRYDEALFATLSEIEVLRRDPYVIFRRERDREIPTRAEAARAVARMADPPLVSIIFPVFNCPAEYLTAAIRSIRGQLYPKWELCVADDASTAPHVRPLLLAQAAADSRVRIMWRERNGNISAASNTALEMARGEFVALVDNDDLIEPDALLLLVQAARARPDVDMLYSDEDKVDEVGWRFMPFFKPDWSPDYLHSCMYTCHMAMFRANLVREVGGFRSRYDGAQDWDLALRVSRLARRIAHVPRVLYHWRSHATSMARATETKPHAHFAAQAALRDWLAAGDVAGRVETGPLPCMFHVRYEIVGGPLVSIVVPTAGAARAVRGKQTDLVANLIERVLAITEYPNYEIIVVADGDLRAETRRRIDHQRVRVLPFREPKFNFARKCNLGARAARGDHVLLLNDDTEPINGDWLTALLEFSQQKDNGAAGAKLLFPDGTIQHVGVTLQGRLPGHPFYGMPGGSSGHFNSIDVPRNYSAVTGACLMTKRSLYEEMGGLDEAFPVNYNDVDFCLRLRRRGLSVVYVPYATLYHFEAQSRRDGSVAEWEKQLFLQRWGAEYEIDPFFNPNLNPRYGDFRMGI